MNLTEKALLVLLTICMIIFLIIAIATLVKLMRFLEKAQQIQEKASKIADNAAHVSSMVDSMATKAATTSLVGIFARVVNAAMNTKKSKSDK
jgi:cell division protein FtsL